MSALRDPMECEHRDGYDTCAYVPAGVHCCDCGALILQYIPQPPSVLGYLSATWAWHLEGKPWTSSPNMNKCSHPGCQSPAEIFGPAPGAPVQLWCPDHAHEGGFCYRCGSLEAGHWEFDTNPNHLCLECDSDFLREEETAMGDEDDY